MHASLVEVDVMAAVDLALAASTASTPSTFCAERVRLCARMVDFVELDPFFLDSAPSPLARVSRSLSLRGRLVSEANMGHRCGLALVS